VGPWRAVSIALLGGREAVLDALSRHISNAAVVERACGALANLAGDGVARGCITTVAAADSQTLCVLAAGNLEEISRAVLRALEQHRSSAAVAEEACGALRNLAANGAPPLGVWSVGLVQLT
jgi:hypothetical protein